MVLSTPAWPLLTGKKSMVYGVKGCIGVVIARLENHHLIKSIYALNHRHVEPKVATSVLRRDVRLSSIS